MTPHKHISSGFALSLALAVAFASLAGSFAVASTDYAGSVFNVDIAQASQDRDAAEADAIMQAATDEESPPELDPLEEQRAASGRVIELSSLIAARREQRKNIEKRTIQMVAEEMEAELKEEQLQLEALREMETVESQAVEGVIAGEIAARAEETLKRQHKLDLRRSKEKAQFDFGI